MRGWSANYGHVEEAERFLGGRRHPPSLAIASRSRSTCFRRAASRSFAAASQRSAWQRFRGRRVRLRRSTPRHGSPGSAPQLGHAAEVVTSVRVITWMVLLDISVQCLLYFLRFQGLHGPASFPARTATPNPHDHPGVARRDRPRRGCRAARYRLGASLSSEASRKWRRGGAGPSQRRMWPRRRRFGRCVPVAALGASELRPSCAATVRRCALLCGARVACRCGFALLCAAVRTTFGDRGDWI